MRTLPLFIALVLAGSGVSYTAEGTPGDAASLARSNTAFALDLYSRLKNDEGNLFFCPYGISTALAMTYGGARGNTAGEMERALHFTADPQVVHPAFARLEEHLAAASSEREIRLDIANSLWPQADHPFRNEYLTLLKERYRVTVTPLDFVHRTEEARRTINERVERETGERIRELIRPGDLDPATALALVNAVYFKGNWAKRFDESRTLRGGLLRDGRDPVPVHLRRSSQGIHRSERRGKRSGGLHGRGDEERTLPADRLPRRSSVPVPHPGEPDRQHPVSRSAIRSNVAIHLPAPLFLRGKNVVIREL